MGHAGGGGWDAAGCGANRAVLSGGSLFANRSGSSSRHRGDIPTDQSCGKRPAKTVSVGGNVRGTALPAEAERGARFAFVGWIKPLAVARTQREVEVQTARCSPAVRGLPARSGSSSTHRADIQTGRFCATCTFASASTAPKLFGPRRPNRRIDNSDGPAVPSRIVVASVAKLRL
jgi:hypothetical protein